MKGFMKKICFRIVALADQYQREQLQKKFALPRNVVFDKMSIEGNVEIGEMTYVNEYSRIDSGMRSKVTIGKHCAIGRHVHVTAKTHGLQRPTSDETHPEPQTQESDVVIGNYVWIGDKVTILPGVTIGDPAIIAAHAVVNANVLPFEVVGGIPAKHIRFNKQHDSYSNPTSHE